MRKLENDYCYHRQLATTQIGSKQISTVKNIPERLVSSVIMLGWASKGYFFLLILLVIFLYSVAHTSVYAALGLEAGNKNILQQQMSRSQEMNNPEGINALKSEYSSSSSSVALRSCLAGTPQIPYTGLVTRSMSPSLAERLGLDATTRGDVIVDIIPGSPAEGLGMRALNMSRSGSI
jgi:hypothetical protein